MIQPVAKLSIDRAWLFNPEFLSTRWLTHGWRKSVGWLRANIGQVSSAPMLSNAEPTADAPSPLAPG